MTLHQHFTSLDNLHWWVIIFACSITQAKVMKSSVPSKTRGTRIGVYLLKEGLLYSILWFFYTKLHPWSLAIVWVAIDCSTNLHLAGLDGAFRLDTNVHVHLECKREPTPDETRFPPKGPLRPLRYTLNSCMKGTYFQHFVRLLQGRLIRLQSWEHNHTIGINGFSSD